MQASFRLKFSMMNWAIVVISAICFALIPIIAIGLFVKPPINLLTAILGLVLWNVFGISLTALLTIRVLNKSMKDQYLFSEIPSSFYEREPAFRAFDKKDSLRTM